MNRLQGITGLRMLASVIFLGPSQALALSDYDLIAKNEKLTQFAILNCAPNGTGQATLYVDPNITSDTLWNGVGDSWTLFVHSIDRIHGVEYYRGHLVSPRGGHQPEIGYAKPSEWGFSEM